jgi:hypothetical protein
MEAEMMLKRQQDRMREQEECDDVESVFLRDLSPTQRGQLFNHVGMLAETPTNKVEWSTCSKCGGADPEGEGLVKRRKVATCIVCGRRKRGSDHTQCKQDKAQQAAAFRTPKATLVSRRDHIGVGRKILIPPKEKRATRKPRQLRKGKGRRVSEDQWEQLKTHI